MNASTGNVVLVGSIDVTAKIQLNGWRATWTQTSDVWTGPAALVTLRYACREANGALTDGHCVGIGGFKAATDTVYRTNQWIKSTYTLHGYHDDVFYWQYKWSWKAVGWSGWTWQSSNSYLKSPQYDCREAVTQHCVGK